MQLFNFYLHLFLLFLLSFHFLFYLFLSLIYLFFIYFTKHFYLLLFLLLFRLLFYLFIFFVLLDYFLLLFLILLHLLFYRFYLFISIILPFFCFIQLFFVIIFTIISSFILSYILSISPKLYLLFTCYSPFIHFKGHTHAGNAGNSRANLPVFYQFLFVYYFHFIFNLIAFLSTSIIFSFIYHVSIFFKVQLIKDQLLYFHYISTSIYYFQVAMN